MEAERSCPTRQLVNIHVALQTMARGDASVATTATQKSDDVFLVCRQHLPEWGRVGPLRQRGPREDVFKIGAKSVLVLVPDTVDVAAHNVSAPIVCRGGGWAAWTGTFGAGCRTTQAPSAST